MAEQEGYKKSDEQWAGMDKFECLAEIDGKKCEYTSVNEEAMKAHVAGHYQDLSDSPLWTPGSGAAPAAPATDKTKKGGEGE